jgi:CRISPR-associated protein Csm5
LKSKAVYSIAAQDGVFNDNEIAPFVKQARSPYIPGTELKGATRTAILYCAMRDDAGLQEWLKGELKAFQTHHSKSLTLVANERNLGKQNPYNQRQKLSKLKESLEREMSRISGKLEEKVLTCKPDAKYDVMKFMQVGDSHLLNGASSLVVSFAEPFNMYNKFKIYYEYLRPDTLVPLTSFKLEDDKSRDIKLKKMEFTERHKQLMSGLDEVLSCCHRFAADLLAEEIAYFTQHNTSIVKDLRRIENLNSPQAPVLRIGKDQGYTSLTVGLAVKKLMPELYENVLIHATKNKSYDSQHGGPFPKSRKIVHWEGQELTAGWVQLIPSLSDQPTLKPSQEKTASTQSKSGSSVDFSSLADKYGKGKR